MHAADEKACRRVYRHFLAGARRVRERRSCRRFSHVAIGLTLALTHPIGVPLTNISVNPARSTGAAVFVQGWALPQLGLFPVAPLLGVPSACWYRFATPGWARGARDPGGRGTNRRSPTPKLSTA